MSVEERVLRKAVREGQPGLRREGRSGMSCFVYMLQDILHYTKYTRRYLICMRSIKMHLGQAGNWISGLPCFTSEKDTGEDQICILLRPWDFDYSKGVQRGMR